MAYLVKLWSGQQGPCHPVHACRAIRVYVVHELFECLGPDVGYAQLFHLNKDIYGYLLAIVANSQCSIITQNRFSIMSAGHNFVSNLWNLSYPPFYRGAPPPPRLASGVRRKRENVRPRCFCARVCTCHSLNTRFRTEYNMPLFLFLRVGLRPPFSGSKISCHFKTSMGWPTFFENSPWHDRAATPLTNWKLNMYLIWWNT